MPQMVRSAGINTLGPIFRNIKFDGSSETIYGLRIMRLGTCVVSSEAYTNRTETQTWY
jgi:hypothetical protein